MNRFGSHSPLLAASSARVSEPDILLIAAREQLTVSSPNTPPLGAGMLYFPILLAEIEKAVKEKKVKSITTDWIMRYYEIGYARSALLLDELNKKK